MDPTKHKLVSKRWPETHLLNPDFPYIPADKTNVARTFRVARFKLELERRMQARKGKELPDVPF